VDGRLALPLLWTTVDDGGGVKTTGARVGVSAVLESVENGILLANSEVEKAVVEGMEKVAVGGMNTKELVGG